jgi:smad nuclear-interacting protein 1
MLEMLCRSTGMEGEYKKSKYSEREKDKGTLAKGRRSRSRDRGSSSPSPCQSSRFRRQNEDRAHNSPPRRRERSRSRSRSRERRKHENESHRIRRDPSPPPASRKPAVASAAAPKSERIVWGNVGVEEEYEEKRKKENGEDIPEEEKEKPNFGLSGALAKDEVTGNIYNGVLLKWTEPLDAAPPPKGWRIYVFKGDEIVETLYLHRQSAYLFGRETRVADHVLAHPSSSSQHAVIQFRAVSSSGGAGDEFSMSSKRRVVKPYLMDLASTNKTLLNSVPLEDSRYYELKPKDVIKFGNSSREYVVIFDKEDAAAAAGGVGGGKR